MSQHLVLSNPTRHPYLCVVFIVALVTTAAFWTAAEAYVVDEVKVSRASGSAELNAPPCEPPKNGNWTGQVAGDPLEYHVDISAVAEGIYNGIHSSHIRSR